MWASAPTGVTRTRDQANTQACPSYRPVGADALVGPRQPPGQRQRKEEGGVSGPSPDQMFPQGERV